jgi:hypothetical protein
MTAIRPHGTARPARACAAYLRAACSRSIRWFDAPRRARTRRRRRTAFAAAALAAGSAVHAVAPLTMLLAPDAPTGVPVMSDVPTDAPFALVLRTTIPTPMTEARVVVYLAVVNSAGWRATLTVHVAPTAAAPLPPLGARPLASHR